MTTRDIAFPNAGVEAELTTMTRPEADRLQELEAKIENHGRRFAKDTYQLLLEIHDRKLYRARHRSFADYCLNRWGWTARSTLYYHLGQAKEAVALADRAKQNGTRPGTQKVAERAVVDARKVRERNGKGAGQSVRPSRISAASATPAPTGPERAESSPSDRVLARAIGLIESVGSGSKWAATTTRPNLLHSIDALATWAEAARAGLAKRGIEV